MIAKQSAVKRYIVMLSAEEREQLNELIEKGNAPGRQLLKTRIPLNADVSDGGEGWTEGIKQSRSVRRPVGERRLD